jgi:tetratricopeptide (TPR) repeat protein
MKSIARQGTRWLLLIVLVLSLIAGSGCGPKPITKATLDYFYGLANQQYWQSGTSGLTLDDEYGTKQVVIAPTGTSDKQQYMAFGDVAVTGSDPKVGPTDAVIKAKVFDGTAEKVVRVRVNEANLATLQKTLSDAFESKSQRDQRIKGDAYAAKLKEADTLLAGNKMAEAIVAFKAAQAINDTDEVKTRLDAIYLKQGKDYYAQKEYDVALAQLKLVSFDPASVTEAQGLLLAVQAEVDKAAVAKAAADKAAAEKAAAVKVAAQRRTWFDTLESYWAQFYSLADEMTTVFAAQSDPRPTLSEIRVLNENILAYRDGHRGMNPSELDQMGVALARLVENVYKGYLTSDLLTRADWWTAAARNSIEYRRLRAIVAQRYGY